jgi:hypothetical protein
VLRSTIEREIQRIGLIDSLIGMTTTEVRHQVVGSFVRLIEPRFVDGGGFQFRVIGDFGAGVRAEYSDDLIHWTPLEGSVLDDLPATVLDIDPALNNARYYRVVRTP